MALRISDEDYEKQHPNLNPGEVDYSQKFEGLKNAEAKGTLNNDETKNGESDSSTINKKEEEPKGDWKNNFSSNRETPVKTKGKGRFSNLKKKGPLTAILLTVIGGGIGIGGLLSPSLLIVNFKEVMVNKFNTQLTSMDIRTTKMLKSKTFGKFGICSSGISIRCKYASMSDWQINRFKKAGIEVISGSDKTIFGRTKPDTFRFKGEDISPNELIAKANVNTELRSALKKGYSPLFGGFADKIWNKTILKLKITNGKLRLSIGDDSKKLKGIQDMAEEGIGKPTISNKLVEPDVDTNGKPIIDKDFNSAKLANESLSDVASQASKASTSRVKAVSEVIAGSTVIGNTMKITGYMDNVCLVYSTVRAIGFAAKAVRGVQLARYAFMFLNIADQIKAGANPDPEDVSYLGKVLTTDIVGTITLQGAKKAIGKTATDSFGYRYAAYNEKGPMSDVAGMFLAGGGLTGWLINLTSDINKAFPPGTNPDTTCKILNNVFVQIGSTVIGIASAIASGGITITAGAVASSVLVVASFILPGLLADLVAGVVIDKDTVGEAAGDAITSGSSGLMGEVAAAGGNAPLTPEQAVAYNNLSNNIAAQYAEEDRLAYSPFDVTNQNTFMGNIFAKLVPTLSNISSLSFPGIISSVASLTTGSLSSIVPKTNAVSASDYSTCQDADYRKLNLATDPYCNVMYGIPVDVLQIDPDVVLDKMQGQIIDNVNDDTMGQAKPGSDYEKFLNNCINRDRQNQPLGYNDVNNSAIGDGSGCKVDDTNKYYYLYFIDQRVEQGMDVGDGSTTTNTPVATTNPIQLTITDPVLTLSKIDDGTTSSSCTPGTLSGVISGETVTVTCLATYDTPDIGTGKTITATYILGGDDAANYIKPENNSVTTGIITAKPTTPPPNLLNEKQKLAQKIIEGVNNNKIKIDSNRTGYLKLVQDVADGKNNGNDLPCGVNINILKSIVDLYNSGNTFRISSLNRICDISSLSIGVNGNSRHKAGNGSAIDYANFNGQSAYSQKQASIIINASNKFMAGYMNVGQKQCEGYDESTMPPASYINDECTHLHIGTSPETDNNLYYLSYNVSKDKYYIYLNGSYTGYRFDMETYKKTGVVNKIMESK